MTSFQEIERRFRSVETETALLSYGVRKDPTVLQHVEPSWFSVSAFRGICRIIKTERVPMGQMMLIQEARRKRVITSENESAVLETISKLNKEPISHITKKGALLLAQQLAELHDSSRMLLGIKDILGSMQNGWDVKEAQKILKNLSRTTSIAGTEFSGEYVEDYEERVEIIKERANALQEGDTSKIFIPTGIDHFDRWMGGGLLKSEGEWGIVLGKPNVGKTPLLINIGAYNYSLGQNVLYCSGETGKSNIQFKIDTYISGIKNSAFRKGDLTSEELKRWQKSIDLLRSTKSNFFEVATFPRHFTAEAIESRIIEIEDKYQKPVDLVLLDYINLMEPKQGQRGEWRTQADAVWDFKGLLKEHNGGIAGWTAGQIPKEALDKEILEIGDSKYAGAINETAPIVVGLVQTDDDVLEKRIQFQVIKLRESAYTNKVIYLHPALDIMRINDALQTHSLKDLRVETGDLNEVRAKKKAKRSNSYGR